MPRVRRDDGQASAAHAQQDCRPFGITAGGKPTDVVGRAVFAIQHGFFRWEIRRATRVGCIATIVPCGFPFKAMDVPAGPNVADHLLPVHDETLERYNWALIGIEAATKSHRR